MSQPGGEYVPDLDGFIESGIFEFEHELENMWEDKEYGIAMNAFAGRLAELMLQSSESLLVDTDPSFWRKLPEILSEKQLHQDVMLALQLRLAHNYLPPTLQMAQRCLDLTRLVLRANLSKAVQRFLRRVARCYITGYGNECVIVCRAVVENALNDKFDRTKVAVPATPEGKSTMRTRLDLTVLLKWLSPKAASDAWNVWTRGNKAVHNDPDVIKRPLETIQLTVGVLEELYRGT